MNKIKVLDQNTINQIAAGEVIDRPASIVKELMENAIDAGSTMISVEIKDGGTSLIRITDNGLGINNEDISVAFLRHSTSKIENALDLLTVSSLGFRGEALSSIAAVCQVELITKTKDSITGTHYKIEGGKETLKEEIGAPEGTTFIVRNIFFNTPARRKFLKTNQTEAGYISEIIEKIALSHPDISINFVNNRQTKLHTSGNGNLKDVIYNIYGKDVTDNLIEIQSSNEFITMSGFIGKAIISKGNRSGENYFINGRYIKNNIISNAIEDGYKFVLMQHKYPFTVINFQIDQQYLDVNVHPAKMELRLQNAAGIYPFISESISNSLIEKPNIIDVRLEEEQINNIAFEKVNNPEPFEKKRIELNHIIGDASDSDDNSTYIKENISAYNESKTEYPTQTKPIQQDITHFYEDFISEPARTKHKLIGQVFGTFWIVEYNDKMYIIDQHAAHEKVMFEKLMKNLANKKISSQMINPPIILNLSLKEAAFIEKYMNNFKEIGFEIEAFGGQDYAVRAIPADLYTLDSEEVLMSIIDSLSEESAHMIPDIVTDKIASMSCKAAVKGNTDISVDEANALIDQLLTLDNPYNCPHGRPTIISMSKYELEKKFKRII